MPAKISPDSWLNKRIRELLDITQGWEVPHATAFRARPWTWLKLGVLSSYLPVYLRILRPRFKRLVFLDLFAGSGVDRYDSGGTPICVPGSSLVAASYHSAANPGARPLAFDSIVAVEKDPARARSLEAAVGRFGYVQGPNLSVLRGDCNDLTDQILDAVSGYGTHVLLFADPEALDLHYSTLSKLLDKHPATDVFVTHLVSGSARTHSERSDKKDRFYGTHEWAGLSTRAEYADLYSRQLGLLREYVHALPIQAELNGYYYDLMFAVRATSTSSQWQSAVVNLRPKIARLSGADVELVLRTVVPRAIAGRRGVQQMLDSQPVQEHGPPNS